MSKSGVMADSFTDAVAGKGTALVVVGSTSPMTHRQIERLLSHSDIGHVAVNPSQFVKSDAAANSEMNSVVKIVSSMLNQAVLPRAIVVETASLNNIVNFSDEDGNNGLSAGAYLSHVNHILGRIISQIVDHDSKKINGIYVAGEETMLAVCCHLGANTIELIPSAIPQTQSGRLIGGSQEGLLLIWQKSRIASDYVAEDIVNRLSN